MSDCEEHNYIYTHEGNVHHTVYHYHKNNCPYCRIEELEQFVEQTKNVGGINVHLTNQIKELEQRLKEAEEWNVTHSNTISRIEAANVALQKKLEEYLKYNYGKEDCNGCYDRDVAIEQLQTQNAKLVEALGKYANCKNYFVDDFGDVPIPPSDQGGHQVKYTDKELLFIVDRISKNLYELSDWERSFFESIHPRVLAGIPLSSKQQEVLSKIWDKLEEV